MYILLGAVIAAVGVWMLISPASVYRLTQGWKNGAASGPSDLYILSTRIGGGFFLVVGIIGIVALALLS